MRRSDKATFWRQIMINLDPEKLSCGCAVGSSCGCKLKSFTATEAELKRLTKGELFTLYTRCISDEMSPIMWRGFTKPEIMKMFLGGGGGIRSAPAVDSIELTPFI